MSLLKNTVCIAVAGLACTLGAVTLVRSEDNSAKTVSTQKPADPKPSEAKPAESKQSEPKPAQAKPTEPKPAEIKPAETDAAAVRAKNAVRAKGEITFDDIKLDLQKDEPYSETKMTDAVRKLNAQKVKLRGYILPTSVFQQKGIKQFVLVRDNKECCFGPGAALYDCVVVNMEEGATADFTTRVVAVTGKFEIDTKSFVISEGKHYAIYKITATSVQ